MIVRKIMIRLGFEIVRTLVLFLVTWERPTGTRLVLDIIGKISEELAIYVANCNSVRIKLFHKSLSDSVVSGHSISQPEGSTIRQVDDGSVLPTGDLSNQIRCQDSLHRLRGTSVSSQLEGDETQESVLRRLRSIVCETRPPKLTLLLLTSCLSQGTSRNPLGESQDTQPLSLVRRQQMDKKQALAGSQQSSSTVPPYTQVVHTRIQHALWQREEASANGIDNDLDGPQVVGPVITCECGAHSGNLVDFPSHTSDMTVLTLAAPLWHL
jgi:hypothetical protein